MVADSSSLPWVEKYRPRSVSEVCFQDEIVATLQRIVQSGASHGDMPHMLLYGPPGTGKTSAALALCRDLFGKGDGYKARVMELNASDERGIQVVREKIKTFAQLTVPALPMTSGRPSAPPFKVVVLDEADAITADAQTALRRTMEAHSRTTRFILICNYVSRIIGPLSSRCAKFRFSPLSVQAMFERLKFVAREEGVQLEDGVLHDLINSSQGDLRKAITTLQSAYRIASAGTQLTSSDVASAACLVPKAVIEEFDVATSNSSLTHKALREKVTEIVRAGYSTAELMSWYAMRIMDSDGPGVARLNDVQKSAIAIAIAQADANLINGADELLQAYSMVSKISAALNHPDNVELLKSM